MSASVTIALDERLEAQLQREAIASGRARDAVIVDALRRQLDLNEFRRLCRSMSGLAEAQGVRSEEELLRGRP